MNNNAIAKVSISSGNSKMGAIPSVSLPACITCNPGAPCFRKCYARRIAARRSIVRDAYQRNFDILRDNAESYWKQVEHAVFMSRYFRFHVSGDIPDIEYMENLVRTAVRCKDTNILVFTKQYDIVNTWISEHGMIPENLHIIFSMWDSAWNVRVHNPHDMPRAHVIFKNSGSDGSEYTKTCGGNCTECACRNTGCWTLKNGESIGLFEH